VSSDNGHLTGARLERHVGERHDAAEADRHVDRAQGGASTGPRGDASCVSVSIGCSPSRLRPSDASRWVPWVRSPMV
jgi:hypothetical protein